MNRLLGIPTEALANRGVNDRTLVLYDVNQRMVPNFARYYVTGEVSWAMDRAREGWVGNFGPDAWRSLIDVALAPTPEEVSDLAFIDRMLSTPAVVVPSPDPAASWRKADAFFTPPPAAHRVRYFWQKGVPPRIVLDMNRQLSAPVTGLRDRWENHRTVARNVERIDRMMYAVAWPGRFWLNAFFDLHGLDLGALAAAGRELTDDDVMIYLTVGVLVDYDALARRVDKLIEEKMERVERYAIVSTIVIIGVGMFLGAAAGALAGASKIALQQLEQEQKQQLAENVARTASAFDGTAPAFADQIRRVARLVDPASAERGFLAPIAADPPAPSDDDALRAELAAKDAEIARLKTTPTSPETLERGQRTETAASGYETPAAAPSSLLEKIIAFIAGLFRPKAA